ncbi:MAG TPA: Fur family transcriptional regulator [Dermatophilaceae bacterium]|nr:Fur family transcriptional regulator [Dermatophilaceae bacterium]
MGKGLSGPAGGRSRADLSGQGSSSGHPGSDISAGAAQADVGASLRARGMRMTAQRERVLSAVRRLGHATPDAVAEATAADGGAGLPLSTVYRNLEALENIGVVSHTHLDHRAPTYHLSVHANHLHLVCLGCGTVTESGTDLADDFVAEVLAQHGFTADVRHMAIHGWCMTCGIARD